MAILLKKINLSVRTAIKLHQKFSKHSKTSALKLGNQAAESVCLHVIGSGVASEPASVCLTTPNENYLFNCGEGSHRLLQNQKQQIHSINNIFVTQLKWNCIGGISSVSKSILYTNRHLPQYHGPENLYKVMKRILCLSIMSELEFWPSDCNQNAHFEDDTFRIEFISLKSSVKNSNALAYLGKIKANDGKLSSEHLQAPVYFMIIDVPSKDYFQNFDANSALSKNLCEINASGSKLDLIVHFSPQSVVEMPKYKEFFERVNARNQLFLNESNESSRLTSVYEQQAKLNRIDENIHPCLKTSIDATATTCHLKQSKRNVKDQNNQFYVYYSRSSKKSSNDLHLDASVKRLDIDNEPQFNFERFKIFPKIVFLGTASSMATPRRNVTSILVHTARKTSILLDCGEGTFGQLYRLYGKDTKHLLGKIKAVFISHLHIDHHGGLIELLRMRKEYLRSDREPLFLLCPKADLKSWLFFYDNEVDAIHDDLYFIDNENLMTSGLSYGKCKELGVTMLRTCRVNHFNTSYAISLATCDQNNQNQFKLTFSGDTPPCEPLVKLGKNSTLLIHEATYPDEMIEKAIKNRHCTISQAIEQSRQMNAKHTILTHFSRHLREIAYFDSKLAPDIGLAFDNMEIVESDLPKLGELYAKHKNERITLW